jgi:hypothetical protein
MKALFVMISLGLLALAPALAEDLSPAEKGLKIAVDNDQINSGYQGIYNELEMTLVNAHGDKIVRKMTNMTTETKNDGDKSIIEFEWPADVKGTRMLSWTHKKGDDDQWLYLPSIKRVKRISSRNRSGSFMGSEFAYEDLGSDEFDKYDYTWLRDEELNGRDCYVLQRVPRDSTSGYSKQIAWADREYHQPQRIVYYDRKGEKLKTSDFSQWVKTDKWWFFDKIDVVNHQTGKSSILVWKDRKVGQKYDDNLFTQSRLIR